MTRLDLGTGCGVQGRSGGLQKKCGVWSGGATGLDPGGGHRKSEY